MSNDITFCANSDCPKAPVCRRSRKFIIRQTPPVPLSFAAFAPDPETGECESYWPIDTIDIGLDRPETQGAGK